MLRYSDERKDTVIDKLLSPHNLSIPDVASQEGISTAMLYNWLKQARTEARPVPGSRKSTHEDWSSQDKFAVVLETACRYVVIWEVHERESGDMASRLIHKALPNNNA